MELTKGSVQFLVIISTGWGECVWCPDGSLYEFIVQFLQYLIYIFFGRRHDHVESLGGGVIFVTGSGIVVSVCKVHFMTSGYEIASQICHDAHRRTRCEFLPCFVSREVPEFVDGVLAAALRGVNGHSGRFHPGV